MPTATLAPISAAPLDFEPYRHASVPDLEVRILAAKAELGESLLILGHHYQQDEVIQFADLRGDSYKLAQMASRSDTCRWIVFCGVHFMAETADILTRPEVDVILPDMAAGCSMADMADLDSVEAAWSDLGDVIDTEDLMPVTYINSAADLKAFCGRHGGVVCTSSNASGSCSSPTSISVGTRRERWECPWSRCPSGRRPSRWAARPRPSGELAV
jgi:quinolinate synthase